MANTPNLDLVKPAGTDKALVSVINSNSDKIDGGYGTLSEQCAKFNNLSNPMVTCTTNEEIENAVANKVAAMDNNTSALIYINANVGGLYLAGGRWCGLLQKANSNTLFSCFFTSYAATNGPMLYRNVNGTKTWQQLAITPVVAYTETAFSVNTNTYGVAAVPSASIPTVSGRTRVMLVLANFTSSELSASQIPPTIVETSSGNVFILGSPSKTYSGLQLKGLFI